ncbi:TPA: aspartate ammonia-lyase, partial [Bacillus cereus]|nr:aspartate ammonia-lyase [Bacillus cereus]
MATLTEVKNGVRIEKDFLGEKEVPNYAYYGVQTMRAVENFPITGYKIHEGLIKAFAVVKKAAALANTDVGRLELNKGGAIAEAAQEILDGKWHDHFIVDPIQGGAGTSMNMNANEVIANRALELLGMEKGDYHYISPNSHVNMAQSTNDAFPTAIHIATLNALEGLLQTMGYMHDVFELKAEQFDHVIKMGRTHLQDAVPIRLGQEFKAYSRVLERDMKRIQQSRQHLYEVN